MQIYVLGAGALEIENSSSTIENVKNVIKNRKRKNEEEGKEFPMEVSESGDQERIARMCKFNAFAVYSGIMEFPTISMIPDITHQYNIVPQANIVYHRGVEWAYGSSSPPKRSSPAIKIDDANDDNVMDSNDHASRSFGSSSMNHHVSSEKREERKSLAEVDKEVANSLKGDDWDRLTSNLRVIPNISRKKVLDAVDLFEEKPTLIRIFLSLNAQEKEEWLVRKLGY